MSTLGLLFRQDPSGDIAKNAALIRNAEFPEHLTRFDSAAALKRAIAASQSMQQRPSGCVFLGAPTERGAADAICDGLLPWLEESGYDLNKDVQVRCLSEDSPPQP